MTAAWTADKDQALMEARRRTPPRPWRWIVLATGFGKSECQRRFKVLASEAGAPVVRVAKPTKAAPRDGMEWLKMKGGVGPRALAVAALYRDAYRDGLDLAPIKSSLNIVEGHGSTTPGLPVGGEVSAVSKLWLFRIRHQVLKGQSDMILALDGVCGAGHMPRELTGGDGHRAREIGTVLRIALDLIVAHEYPTS